MPLDRFLENVTAAIMSLPQDLKVVLRIAEDPDIDDQSRVLAAGSLMHVLSSYNAIPGMRGMVAYVDDVLVLRLALDRIAKRSPEAMERHRKEWSELEPMTEQLEAAREYMGDSMQLIETAVDGLPKLSHQGHTPAECARDVEALNWLYDAVHAAIVEKFEFDEDDVAREVKGFDRLLAPIRGRGGRP